MATLGWWYQIHEIEGGSNEVLSMFRMGVWHITSSHPEVVLCADSLKQKLVVG
jgi:hypothetical protein